MTIYYGAAGGDELRELEPTLRELVRSVVTQPEHADYGRCDFCGSPCYGRTCPAHRDVPDPYQLPRPR